MTTKSGGTEKPPNDNAPAHSQTGTQQCIGCDEDQPKSTFWHVDGDLWLCSKCVDALPRFPQHAEPIQLEGKYPNFKWKRSAA